MTPAHRAEFDRRADMLERDMARIASGPHSVLARQLVARGWHK